MPQSGHLFSTRYPPASARLYVITALQATDMYAAFPAGEILRSDFSCALIWSTQARLPTYSSSRLAACPPR